MLLFAAETSVTLVCTDVEGSTEMWEWDNVAMMEAIDLHDRCMRMHLAKFGGYEIATEGDAFLIAFHTPGNAVAYTAATQQVGHTCLHHHPLGTAFMSVTVVHL